MIPSCTMLLLRVPVLLPSIPAAFFHFPTHWKIIAGKSSLWAIPVLILGVALLVQSESADPADLFLPPAYKRVSVADHEASPADWSKFLGETLERDIARWRPRAPLRTVDVTTLLTERRSKWPAVLRLVLIYNNRIYWPDREDINGTKAPMPSSPLKEAFYNVVSPLLESGKLQLPNVLFLFNSDDNRLRLCSPIRNCSVPTISLIKCTAADAWIGGGGGEGPEGDNEEDEDILIPQFLFVPDSLHQLPWQEKQDLAFFRGTPYCSGYWNGRLNCPHLCPRPYLAWRSVLDEQEGRPRTLDVGMTYQYYGGKPAKDPPCMPKELPVLPLVRIPEHSRYRWLVHLEGITASYRLALLMSVNSLVLFQRSPWMEYFYRALRNGTHYVPFWNTTERGQDDVYDVVAELRHLEEVNPSSVHSIIRESQAFMAMFCTTAARGRYLRAALTAYKSLFPDMDVFLEGYVAELRARGFNITA